MTHLHNWSYFSLRYGYYLHKAGKYALWSFLAWLCYSWSFALATSWLHNDEMMAKREKEISVLSKDLGDVFKVLNGDAVIEERTSDRYVVVTSTHTYLEERYK